MWRNSLLKYCVHKNGTERCMNSVKRGVKKSCKNLFINNVSVLKPSSQTDILLIKWALTVCRIVWSTCQQDVLVCENFVLISLQRKTWNKKLTHNLKTWHTVVFKCSNTNAQLRTLMAACSGVTGLTVALAGQSVAAPVAVPTVACFCAVCAPVACITGCNTDITSEFWSDIREHVLKSLTEDFQHCYLSCSCVPSSQERRYTAQSPGHSGRCSRTRTSSGILDRNVRLGTLHKKGKCLKHRD